MTIVLILLALVSLVNLRGAFGLLKHSIDTTGDLRDDDDSQWDNIILPEDGPSSPLWPQPSHFTLGAQALKLSPDFTFNATAASARLLRGIERYTKLIHSQEDNSVHARASETSGESDIQQCSVQVGTIMTEAEERKSLTLNVDEGFILNVTDSGNCKISASTIWGALYAMETFTQLLSREEGLTVLTYAPVSVSDAARYSHRGFLMDTARFFLPLKSVRQTIDALAMNKMNVLHWHLSDAESFPFDSSSLPLLKKGAYTPSQLYTEAQLRDTTEYALDRGVRLLFEVDGPGHTNSWGKGYPEMMPQPCFSKMPKKCNQCYRDVAANPVTEETFRVLQGVLRDIASSTDAQFLHLGGDEVDYKCWASDPSLRAYMAKHGYGDDYSQLLDSYVQRAVGITKDLGATPLLWEDTFMAGVRPPKDTIFDVWTNSTNVAIVTQAGYRVVAAPADFWYMDHTDNVWMKMYSYDPAAGLTTDQQALLVGGEVSMWGENFMHLGINEYNLIPRSWPQACAVAERLWSSMKETDPAVGLKLGDAVLRLNTQACRMNARGLAASPLTVDDLQGQGFCAVSLV